LLIEGDLGFWGIEEVGNPQKKIVIFVGADLGTAMI